MELKLESFEEKEDKEAALKDFQNEIEQLKREEEEKEKTVHLVRVNPAELISEDAAIWEKIKNESIMKEDLKSYTEMFIDKERGVRTDIPESRRRFLAFVNNKAGGIFIKREIQ